MHNLTDENFEQTLNDNQKTVVLFSASWCAPCRALKPAMVRFAARHKEVKFEIVDIEETPQFTTKMKVMAVPTTILFNGNEPVDRVTGNAMPQIEKFFLS